MGTGIEPTNDFAFKFLFGAEERNSALARLLNAVITDSGGVPMQSVQLVSPLTLKETAHDRLGILDLRARDNWDRESLIEMQMLAFRSLIERLLWYTAKHYDQQLEQGQEYAALRPVIMVCFLNDILFDDDSGQYHWCFKLIDQDSGRQLTDQFVIHIIELPKFNKTVDELVSDLDCWTYFLKHGAGLEVDDLSPQLQKAGITQAVEGLVMLSLDEQKRHEYTRQRMWEMDQRAIVEGSLDQGRLEGIAEGERKGALTILVRMGTRRFGVASTDVLAQLKAIRSVSELEALSDRVTEVSSWSELLLQRS